MGSAKLPGMVPGFRGYQEFFNLRLRRSRTHMNVRPYTTAHRLRSSRKAKGNGGISSGHGKKSRKGKGYAVGAGKVKDAATPALSTQGRRHNHFGRTRGRDQDDGGDLIMREDAVLAVPAERQSRPCKTD